MSQDYAKSTLSPGAQAGKSSSPLRLSTIEPFACLEIRRNRRNRVRMQQWEQLEQRDREFIRQRGFPDPCRSPDLG